MNPFAIFVLAILSPFLLAATLLVPPYLGMIAAAYIIYDKAEAKVHPLSGKLGDVFYMIDVYTKLFSRWSSHIAEANVLSYSVPLIVLPLIGLVVALGLTSRLSVKLQNVFHMGVSSH